jgi:hypothetical protein
VVMYVMYIVLFYRYASHIVVSRIIRANHRDECDLPPTIHTPSICGEPFLLVRTDSTACCHDIIHSYCIKT